MKSVSFTQTGLDNVKKEYEELTEKRKTAVQELKTARELGDLSENAAYKVARQKLSGIDRRLMHLSLLMRKASVVEANADGTVGVGNTVTVKVNDSLITYQIVGTYESDTQSGKISHLSPLGKALLGKRIGETVNIMVPAGKKTYTIVEVSS